MTNLGYFSFILYFLLNPGIRRFKREHQQKRFSCISNRLRITNFASSPFKDMSLIAFPKITHHLLDTDVSIPERRGLVLPPTFSLDPSFRPKGEDIKGKSLRTAFLFSQTSVVLCGHWGGDQMRKYYPHPNRSFSTWNRSTLIRMTFATYLLSISSSSSSGNLFPVSDFEQRNLGARRKRHG